MAHFTIQKCKKAYNRPNKSSKNYRNNVTIRIWTSFTAIFEVKRAHFTFGKPYKVIQVSHCQISSTKKGLFEVFQDWNVAHFNVIYGVFRSIPLPKNPFKGIKIRLNFPSHKNVSQALKGPVFDFFTQLYRFFCPSTMREEITLSWTSWDAVKGGEREKSGWKAAQGPPKTSLFLVLNGSCCYCCWKRVSINIMFYFWSFVSGEKVFSEQEKSFLFGCCPLQFCGRRGFPKQLTMSFTILFSRYGIEEPQI